MLDIKKFIKGLRILNSTDQTKSLEFAVSDSATTNTKTTLVAVQTANRTINIPDSGGVSADVVLTNLAQTLTNKTIDADNNTITNIDNNEIKALAGIDVTKIADGTVSNTEFQFINTVTSNVQTQIDSKVNRSGDTMTGFLTLNADPTSSAHAATKNYVDSLSAGVDPKEAVRAATIADLSATYATSPSNGRFTSAPTSIDGVSLNIGNRVLVKEQTDAKQNGIYVYDAVSQLTRSADMDGTPSSEVSAGNYTLVTAGTNNSGKGFVVLGEGTLTLNTDDINWSEFSFSAGANTFLSNLTAPVAINQDVTPDTNNTKDIGSTLFTFAEGHINNVDTENIRTTTGLTTVDITNRKLIDSASTDSIDWQNRLLKSGATTKLNWTATDISVNTRKITDIVDPTSAQDAATKNYVDSQNNSREHNWELNGVYSTLTFPLLNIDAIFLAPYDITIESVWIYNGDAGTSGTTEYDLKVKSPGGAYATILSTTGKITSAAAADIYTDSGAVVGVQTGVTKPIIATSAILAGQAVKFDLITSMAGSPSDARIRIYWTQT